MARRAIPMIMIAFPRVRCMFIYMFVSPTRVCVVYVVKEVTSFPGGYRVGQLMGVARKRTRDQAQQKESCVAYVETGTNS